MKGNRKSVSSKVSWRNPFYFQLIATATLMMTTSQLLAQTVINNDSDRELMHSRMSDEQGNATSELYVARGKVYLQNGEVVFGTGRHRLKNVDGLGQYISVVPTMFQNIATLDKQWVMGFRVDEMRFHWDFDSERMNVVIVTDALTPHDNSVTAIVDGKPVNSQAKEISFSKRENCLVLAGVADMPYSGATRYIFDGIGKYQAMAAWRRLAGDAPTQATTQDAPKAPTNAREEASKKEIIIRDDGLIAAQDVMVHLTSPVKGVPETLLRDVTITNEFEDDLLLLEIDGAAGARTGALYFDKGQSVHFDGKGVPDSGQGVFKLEGAKDGQMIARWLAPSGSPFLGKKIKTANVEFVRTKSGATEVQLSDVVEVPPA